MKKAGLRKGKSAFTEVSAIRGSDANREDISSSETTLREEPVSMAP